MTTGDTELPGVISADANKEEARSNVTLEGKGVVALGDREEIGMTTGDAELLGDTSGDREEAEPRSNVGPE